MLLLLGLVLLKSSEAAGHRSVHQCIESDFQIAVLYCVALQQGGSTALSWELRGDRFLSKRTCRRSSFIMTLMPVGTVR